MSRRVTRIALPLVLATGVAACARPPEHRATVKLNIDDQSFDYTTDKAQVDQQDRGGRYSVYLLPNDPDGKAPYLCLRTYQANPVAELWVRFTKPERAAEAGSHLDKYDCFVPGTLSDGRPTLSWTHDDGTKRKRTATGQESCSATVRKEGSSLHVDFDALLRRKAPGKKKGRQSDAPTDAPTDAIKVRGSAVVELGR
jgi:hypothetical protein